MIGARITDSPLDRRTHLVAVEGQIDLHTAPRLNERVQDVLDEGTRRIILDLSSVDFMDSSGLASLLELLRSLHVKSGSMALVVRDLAVERLLRVTGLNSVFLIHRSRARALAGLDGLDILRMDKGLGPSA